MSWVVLQQLSNWQQVQELHAATNDRITVGLPVKR